MHGKFNTVPLEGPSEGARLTVDAEDRFVVVLRVVGIFDNLRPVLREVLLQRITALTGHVTHATIEFH